MIDMFVAATTGSGADYDGLADRWFNDVNIARIVSHIALAGSAAAGDITFELKYGDRTVMTLYCNAVGAVFPTGKPALIAIPDHEPCPAGLPIKLVASGNAATNSVNCIIITKELGEFSLRKYVKKNVAADLAGLVS